MVADRIQDAVDRWEKTLQCLEDNNLKAEPAKTQCFPDSLDLLGWTKKGNLLIPDKHRTNTLVSAELPVTVKNLRSYLGSYNTFYKCKKDISILLSSLAKLTANDKASSAKIDWTPDLIADFKKSQEEAKDMDQLYIPKPADQLVMTQDYCEKGTDPKKGGISATLWAIVDDRPKVVARFSAPIDIAETYFTM